MIINTSIHRYTCAMSTPLPLPPPQWHTKCTASYSIDTDQTVRRSSCVQDFIEAKNYLGKILYLLLRGSILGYVARSGRIRGKSSTHCREYTVDMTPEQSRLDIHIPERILKYDSRATITLLRGECHLCPDLRFTSSRRFDGTRTPKAPCCSTA